MEMKHFNDTQVSMPTDSSSKNAFHHHSQSRFRNQQYFSINSKFDFKKPRFSEKNSYPRIPLSVNRSKLSIPYKSELCMLFQRGKCYFGKNCHYAHSMSEIRKPGFKTAAGMGEYLNEERQRNAVCRLKECYFYSSGRDCPYGDKCYFLHKCDKNVRGDVGLYWDSYAMDGVNGRSDRCGSDQIVWRRSFNAGEDHDELVFHKTKLCIKWERLGSCPYGVKCTYAHGRAELQEPGFSFELERNHAFRLMLDSQPNNAVGIKNAKELMKGERCFMKWDIERISQIYADWVEIDEISVSH